MGPIVVPRGDGAWQGSAVRALLCRSFAPLDQLTVEELPDPVAGPGQVVVDVEAAGANFVDALLVQGLYQIKPPLPFTPGMEVAGRVSSVGAGVEGLAVGDRVLGTSFFGGYASRVVLAAAAVVPVPTGLTPGQAAGLVQSYATMLFALTRRTSVAPGEWVAVLGAGGGIGLATVDLAKALGANVVACASSPEKLAAAEAAGADATVAYDDDGVDPKAAIREATGGGADVLVDPIGGPKAEAGLRALRWMGRFVVIGFAAGDIPRIPLNQVLLNNRTVVGIDWGAWTMRDPAGNRALLDELLAMAADGRVTPVEPQPYPLESAALALADLQGRQVAGKVVIVP
jgi:NADPH2:quinone reductase